MSIGFLLVAVALVAFHSAKHNESETFPLGPAWVVSFILLANLMLLAVGIITRPVLELVVLNLVCIYFSGRAWLWMLRAKRFDRTIEDVQALNDETDRLLNDLRSDLSGSAGD